MSSGGYSSQGNYGDSTGTSYGSGGAYGGSSDDFSGAMHHAQAHSGNSGDQGMFQNALSSLQGGQGGHHQIDEDEAVRQHQQMYGQGGNGQQQASSGAMGGAAAMQALKMFTGGGGQSAQGGQGGSQNQFIGMAMAQASKLFGERALHSVLSCPY